MMLSTAQIDALRTEANHLAAPQPEVLRVNWTRARTMLAIAKPRQRYDWQAKQWREL